METKRDRKKDLIAWGTLVMSVIGVILGIVSKSHIFNTFTAGTWITFAAFMLSLSSVQDHGSNRLAASAFYLTFFSMVATIFLGTTF